MTESGDIASQTDSLFDRVNAVVQRIRPAVQDDDGDIELVDVTEDKVARIRFHGACISCPSRSMTLQSGIEQNVCAQVPEITAVVQVE